MDQHLDIRMPRVFFDFLILRINDHGLAIQKLQVNAIKKSHGQVSTELIGIPGAATTPYETNA